MKNINNYDLIKSIKIIYFKTEFLLKDLCDEGFTSMIVIIECFYDLFLHVKESIVWDLSVLKKLIKKV